MNTTETAAAEHTIIESSTVLKLIWQTLVKQEKMLEKAGVGKTAPIYMNVTEAAQRYDMGRNMVYDLMALPSSPPAVKVGGKVLLNIAQWDEYIANFDNAREGWA